LVVSVFLSPCRSFKPNPSTLLSQMPSTNFKSLLFFVLLTLSSCAQASFTKTRRNTHKRPVTLLEKILQPTCDVSTALLEVPGEGDVNPTPGDSLSYITLGIGAAQYECKADQTWSPVGQRGILYDASCLYSAISPEFLGLTQSALLLPDHTESALSKGLQSLTGKLLKQLGTFYLHENLPKFDMRERRGGSYTNEGESGYAVTTLVADQVAPVASYDVDWQKYETKQGSLANSIFRVSTSGGVPSDPKCLQPGTTVSVPFAAQYWFFTKGAHPTADGTVVDAKDAPSSCKIAEPSKDKKRSMAVMLQSVIYGDTKEDCKSVDECNELCLKDKNCEGWIISTEDGQGQTKQLVTSNDVIFSSVFNAGIVREITGTEYIDRYGFVQACPDGLVTSESNTGCVAPVCL